MASIIELRKLDDLKKRYIRSSLTFVPDSSNNFYTTEEEQPVLLYLTDSYYLYLPFSFACNALLRDLVIPIAPETHLTTALQFTGTLRSHQLPVVTEAVTHLERYGTTTIGLPPGAGKTVIGAYLSVKYKLLTIVFVPLELLTFQWKNTFTSNTNAKVWIVGTKDNIGLTDTMPDVIICMSTRWQLIPASLRGKIGFVIIDEAHMFCTPTQVGCLLSCRPKYIVAETATFERDDNMHTMMQAICGTHGIFKLSNKPFTVVKVLTGIKGVKTKTRGGRLDWIPFLKSVLFDPIRLQLIIDMVKSNPTFKILILSALVEHVMELYTRLSAAGIECDYLCGRKKTYTDSKVLVGTISKIGTGFDQASSCPAFSGEAFNMLILASSIKKYNLLVQNIGRVFRADYPYVLHLVDDDSVFRNHWQKAANWYTKRGGVINDNPVCEIVTSPSISTLHQTWLQNRNKLKAEVK